MEKPKMEIRAEPALWADHAFRMYAEAYRQGLVGIDGPDGDRQNYRKARSYRQLIEFAENPWELARLDSNFKEWLLIYNSTKWAPLQDENTDVKKLEELKRLGRYGLAILIGVILGHLIAAIIGL